MSRTLVIDTATKACSVALFDGSDCIASHHEIIGRGHAEKLIPFIQMLPGKGRADKIMVNVGPGSFTGIRVGISAAKALALAWNAECSGYHSLPLIAAMAGSKDNVDAVMAGGHGEYFFQSFDKNGIALNDPVSLKPEEAAALSAAPIVAGDVSENIVKLRGNGISAVHLPDASQWHRISHFPPFPASAFYGRAPDAKPPSKKPVSL